MSHLKDSSGDTFKISLISQFLGQLDSFPYSIVSTRARTRVEREYRKLSNCPWNIKISEILKVPKPTVLKQQI